MVIFAALQPVLSRLIPSHLVVGAVGLASTFVALLLTNLISSGLAIKGVGTWILATLIVWVVTMLATWHYRAGYARTGLRLTGSASLPLASWRIASTRSATPTKRRSRLLRLARMGSASDGTSQLLSPDPGPILFAWQELIVLRHQEALGFG